MFCISGESIPIRLFLAGYDLTPTMRDINKKFSVRYYLNLVLIDEEERRYFKQQVIKNGAVSAQLFCKFQLTTMRLVTVNNDLACVLTVRCVTTFVAVLVFVTVHGFCVGFKSGL